MVRIGIDIGGTGVKAGVVDENNVILEQTYAPTKAGRPAEEIVADICAVAESALNLSGVPKSECAGVGIACAGTCDPEAGMVRRAYNLGFFDVPICELVSARLGLPAKLANDADAAALAEVTCGSAAGRQSALYICLGTGVGAGLIIDGKIYSGCGFGGTEAGHMKIVLNGRRCTCGENGCFEAYASATALINLAKEAAAEHPESALNDLPAISGRTVFETAAAGDPVADGVVDRYAEYLAAGITNLVNILDPEIVVIGGGVAGAGERLMAPVRSYVAEHIYGGTLRTPPVITATCLGETAGILGGAALAGQKD